MIGLRVLQLISPGDAPLERCGAVSLTHWLRTNGHDVAVLSCADEAQNDFADEDVTTFQYPAGKKAWWQGRRKEVLHQLGAWNPDVLHVHSLDALSMATKIATALSIPAVAGAQMMAGEDAAIALNDARIAWVVVPSEVHRAHFITKLGLDRDRVTVLPSGVDLERVTSSFPRNSGGPLVVGAVLPFSDETGLKTIVEAFSALSRDGVTYRGLIAGRGPGKDALKERLVLSGLSESISIIDDNEPMARIVRQMDILVHVEHAQPVSSAVLEAMACARPVVAAAVGWIADLVLDGQNGLLIPPDDAAALDSALRGLLSNSEKVKALGESARMLIIERFDLKLVGQAAVELYRTAVTGCQTTGARVEGTSVYKRITDSKK
jgi:glycosyltransferase involved in cell wall biosynthesis